MNGFVKALLGVVAIIAIIGVLASLFTVEQREQALVLQFGEPKRVIQEPGLFAKLPLVQEAIILDKRLLDYDAPAEEVIASDQKRLVVDAFARFRIEDPLKFYQTVRTEDVLRPRLGAIINSNLRKVLGTVPLQDVISEDREMLMQRIADSVREEAMAFGIRVYDVRIKHADLPQANSEAVFRRMQTERQQEAAELRAKGAEEAQRIRAEADRERVVIVAEAEREGQILRGEGEGESNRIFAEVEPLVKVEDMGKLDLKGFQKPITTLNLLSVEDGIRISSPSTAPCRPTRTHWAVATPLWCCRRIANSSVTSARPNSARQRSLADRRLLDGIGLGAGYRRGGLGSVSGPDARHGAEGAGNVAFDAAHRRARGGRLRRCHGLGHTWLTSPRGLS